MLLPLKDPVHRPATHALVLEAAGLGKPAPLRMLVAGSKDDWVAGYQSRIGTILV